MRNLNVSTSNREEFVDITDLIHSACREDGWSNGVLTVFVPHTTCGVTINENADPNVTTDMTAFLMEMVPQSNQFRHAEGNSDSHIKASLIGPSATLIIRNEKPELGTWQAVYLAEFDGPRRRKIWLKFQAD